MSGEQSEGSDAYNPFDERLPGFRIQTAVAPDHENVLGIRLFKSHTPTHNFGFRMADTGPDCLGRSRQCSEALSQQLFCNTSRLTQGLPCFGSESGGVGVG